MTLPVRKNQRLSIIVLKDSLSCFYTDIENAEFLWSGDLANDFQSDFSRMLNFLHALEPSRVYIFDDSNRFTLLPNELHSWESEQETLDHAISFPDSERIYVNRASKDLVCISERSVQVNRLFEAFSQAIVSHLSIPLINWVMDEQDAALVYFIKNAFYITLSSNSLQFHNRFDYKTKEDVLYYLNSVSEHIQEIDELVIAGFVTMESQLYHGIKSNFPNARMYSNNLLRNQLMFF